MRKKTVCFVAGKSGGHIIPAITLAQKVLFQDPEQKIIFYATNNRLDKKILAPYTRIFSCFYMPLSRIPNGFSRATIFLWVPFLFSTLLSFSRAFMRFVIERPERVVSTGGFVSVPVCCAAWVLQIPVDVYELNVLPGKAVRLLSRFATRVYTCFSQTNAYISHQVVKKKIAQAAYPVYASLPTYCLPKREQARKELDIAPDKKVLFVMGGSQGSAFLNEKIFEFMRSCPREQRKNIVLIHVAGVKNEARVRLRYARYGIDARVYGYSHQIDTLQMASDSMIIRGGAGALFESIFFKKPSIIVPLELGSDRHQVYNAQACQQEHPDLFTVWLQKDIAQSQESFFSDILQQLF